MEDDELVVAGPDGEQGVITMLYDADGNEVGDGQLGEAEHAIVETTVGTWLGCPVADLTLIEASDG